MEIPLTGLALGVVGQVRTVIQSITARVENYCQGPETFQSLNEDLVLLTQNINEVDNVLKKFPSERLAVISPLFSKTLESVRANLLAVDTTVGKEFAKAFAGSKRNIRGHLRRIFRATSLGKNLKTVESRVKESAGQLQHISSVLASALNSIELHDDIIPRFDNLAIIDSAKEGYRRAASVPALPHTVHLNFGAKDAHGCFETPEAMLKHQILSSSTTLTAATGIMDVAETLAPAYGVVGMAGVGKTIALQGLAGDREVCNRFPDGIHYMTFGQGASIQDAIEEIVKIMELTGASSSIAAVRSSRSLKAAVDNAVVWFKGKVCLFLLDDLWPNDGCAIGYLNELRQLLRCSRESRMAISTRSVNIAIGAGSVVDFAARDPHGFSSISIFMKYAGQELTQELLPSASKILSWCGGLPISLSATGSAVGHLTRTLGSFEEACEMYVKDFEGRRTNLGEEEDSQGTRLSDCIHLSLKYLEFEFLKLKERHAVDINHTISDLYVSLCVMTNQVWIPISVLGRMLQLSEKSALDVVKILCGLSLGTLSFRRIGEGTAKKAGLTLHDLHLDFCKQQAGSKGSEQVWNSALLNGYFDASQDCLSLNAFTQSSRQLADVSTRSWWSILEDGYTHANLARHLMCSGNGAELGVLLLDARWANVRGKIGGILGIKADFEILDKLLESQWRGNEENNHSKGIRKSFQLVLKAMQLSWGSFSSGERAFQFQMCGRLLSLRNDDIIIDAAIKSFEVHTPRPYLMPVSQFFPELNNGVIWETPVGGKCLCVDCSSCGRYIAAGAGHDIVVVDSATGDVLKRLKGHRADVRSIIFTARSKKIVSGSEDRNIAVWEWEKSDEPILVLEGHERWVTSVDVSSDCKCIVSVSADGTVRFWNRLTGLQTWEVTQNNQVWCVALYSEGKKVALGLSNGTVKVLDSCTRDTVFEDTEAHTDLVSSVAFSSDGGRLATCSWDETIRIWNTETWTAIGSPVEGHADMVLCVAFSLDGQQLLSACDEGEIILWDIAPAESVDVSSSLPVLSERNIFSSGLANCVTFTWDGARIASGGEHGILRILDATFVAEGRKSSSDCGQYVLCVSISPDGLRVATGSRDGTVRLWDTQKSAPIGIALYGHKYIVACVSFSPDGLHLVSGSHDTTLRMWDTEKFTQVGLPFEGHSAWVLCVAFSSDGLRIVSGSSDQTVRLWNAQTREQIGDPLIGHSEGVRYVSESSDGQFVVSRSGDNDILYEYEETIIFNRKNREIVWRSDDYGSDDKNRITNIEAESIIRSCGHETPHLWPSCFPDYSADVVCEDNTLYSVIQHERILIGNLPSMCHDWKYDGLVGAFTAGLQSGGAICRFEK